MSLSAHGMGLDEVAPDWPRLSVAQLAPVLARYPGLGEVETIVWHSSRPFAASGLVACGTGNVFVKRHDPRVRDCADLAEEHAFIAHLRAHGADTPRVLLRADGGSAVHSSGYVFEVMAVGRGADLYREAHSWTPVRRCEDAFALGAALARLHRAAAGFDAPLRRTRLVVAGDFVTSLADPLAAIMCWIAQDSLLAGALAARDWRREFPAILQPGLAAWMPFARQARPCWVHGDFHASNLLWQDGDVSAVLDFGLSNRATALFDVATAIERNAIAWLDQRDDFGDIGHADLARAILDGYASVLPRPDLRALRCLLPVVHIEFALSELAYFHGITKTPHHADLAYHAFLLGHAQWFGTRDGARFLDRLG